MRKAHYTARQPDNSIAPGGRARRIRERYQREVPYISIQRARYYTESWQSTGSSGLSNVMRVALAMKNVFEKMDIHIDSEDLIAGAWTENYTGIPIDIERGLFNRTLEIELEPISIFKHQVKSGVRYARYALTNYSPLELLDMAASASKIDAPMPSVGSDTIDRRKVNPYRIKSSDRRILLEKLLPYWQGKTVADILRKEIQESDIYTDSFRAFAGALPTTTSREATLVSPGSAIGTWQGHLVLDHETVLRRGLLAMRDSIRRKIKRSTNISGEERDFLIAAETALEGVIVFARRLAEKLEQAAGVADDESRATLEKLLDVCRAAPLRPAKTFQQALQSYWTVKNAVDLAMPFNVHAPGRLDQMFFPYYEEDIASGRITRDEAREMVEELFLKIMSHNMRPGSSLMSAFTQRYEGSEPVTLGGLTRDGRDATNDLTFLMLDAAENSRASLNFVVRFHPGSPGELYEKAAGMYHRGVSSISMMNDEIGTKALRKRGFSAEDANGYAITGCVDMVAPGKTGGEGFSSILLCRILDMALRNGDTKTVAGPVNGAGLRTGAADSFKTFEQFLAAFFAQADNEIRRIAEASRMRDSIFARQLPAPHISVFMGGCIENKKDVTAGGAWYDLEGILLMSSIANAADSLYVIKKLVFEEDKFTLRQLIKAVDDNFKGHARMHSAIEKLPGKWGNGNPESDEIARRITGHIFNEMKKYRTYKGGQFAPFINSMTAHTIDGRVSFATPDGRRAGMPFAASCNPYNVEKAGPTGVLRSVAALDFSEVLGCAVNIRMHPSAIGSTPETRRKWTSMIKAYFRLGGEQLQPTAVSTELLRKAQKNPDEHRDVIVKVGGYSAYFTELGQEIQNEIISRSEHNC